MGKHVNALISFQHFIFWAQNNKSSQMCSYNRRSLNKTLFKLSSTVQRIFADEVLSALFSWANEGRDKCQQFQLHVLPLAFVSTAAMSRGPGKDQGTVCQSWSTLEDLPAKVCFFWLGLVDQQIFGWQCFLRETRHRHGPSKGTFSAFRAQVKHEISCKLGLRQARWVGRALKKHSRKPRQMFRQFSPDSSPGSRVPRRCLESCVP